MEKYIRQEHAQQSYLHMATTLFFKVIGPSPENHSRQLTSEVEIRATSELLQQLETQQMQEETIMSNEYFSSTEQIDLATNLLEQIIENRGFNRTLEPHRDNHVLHRDYEIGATVTRVLTFLKLHGHQDHGTTDARSTLFISRRTEYSLPLPNSIAGIRFEAQRLQNAIIYQAAKRLIAIKDRLTKSFAWWEDEYNQAYPSRPDLIAYIISIKHKYYLECIHIDYLLVQYNSTTIASIGDMDRVDIHYQHDLRTGPQVLLSCALPSTSSPTDIIEAFSPLSDENSDSDASTWYGQARNDDEQSHYLQQDQTLRQLTPTAYDYIDDYVDIDPTSHIS